MATCRRPAKTVSTKIRLQFLRSKGRVLCVAGSWSPCFALLRRCNPRAVGAQAVSLCQIPALASASRRPAAAHDKAPLLLLRVRRARRQAGPLNCPKR